MRILNIIILLLIGLPLLSCSANSEVNSVPCDGRVLNDNSPKNSTTVLSGDYPMPVELAANINTPGSHPLFQIGFYTFNLEQPPVDMFCNLYYHIDELDGRGEVLRPPPPYDVEVYEYVFPSGQVFTDLVEYMADNPDIFFDYSEFEGQPSGTFAFPEGTSEGFYLSLRAAYPNPVTGNDDDYTIAKGIVPGQPSVAEIEYVIDQLRDLRDELLEHPVQ
jgi:hypothetical protein